MGIQFSGNAYALSRATDRLDTQATSGKPSRLKQLVSRLAQRILPKSLQRSRKGDQIQGRSLTPASHKATTKKADQQARNILTQGKLLQKPDAKQVKSAEKVQQQRKMATLRRSVRIAEIVDPRAQNPGIAGSVTSERVSDHRFESARGLLHQLCYKLNIGPKKGAAPQNTIVACGSVSLTSDNDYTFLGKPERVLNPGGPQLRDSAKGDRPLQKVIGRYRNALAKLDMGKSVRKVKLAKNPATGESTGFTRKLNGRARSNALLALAKADNNWFKALEMYATETRQDGSANPDYNPQVIWDIRSLEKELTASVAQAVEDSYGNLSETDMVQFANGAVREIFGKDAGVLFDTNYYTGHAILKEGFQLSSASHKARWQQLNTTQALVKVASNFKALDAEKGQAHFAAFCEQSGISDAMREAAWAKMDNREMAIELQVGFVQERAQEQLHDVQDEISRLPPDSPEARALAQRKLSLESKLQDPEQLKLEAMNDLYMAALEITQDNMNFYNLQQTNACPQEELDAAATAIIDAQTTTLLFANEPYYSQGTVVAVVAGMQMKQDESAYPLLGEQSTHQMCMTENFGDYAKDKHHYQGSPEKFAFRGAKYLQRTLISAETALGDKAQPELSSRVKELSTLASSLLTLRKNPEGLSTEEQKKQSVDAVRSAFPQKAESSAEELMELLFKEAQSVVIDVNRALSAA